MRRNLLILVLALQTAWLGGTVAVQEHALATGKIILLETKRVDPRDLLRGDYLILNYTISDVPLNSFSPTVKAPVPYGARIFVAVAPGTNGFFTVTRAGTNAFAPASDEVVLNGKCTYSGWNATNSVHILYGLENYYVAEGTGNPTGKLTVRAVVPASGRARIKQVFLDGKPYEAAMKETVK